MSFSELKELRSQGDKTIRYMKSLDYKVRALNIIYFEGLNADDMATPNNDRIDQWNDVRSIIGNDGRVYLSSAATTEPGWYYRKQRMNKDGAAQLAFGQHLDCWRFGKHFQQDALVQCGSLPVYRDNNEDGSRAGDLVYTGDYFAINQHTTADYPRNYAPDAVGRWSAGCLVGQHSTTHYNLFLPICRSMGLATFDTTLFDGSAFAKFQ
jgi:hypothetical protein